MLNRILTALVGLPFIIFLIHIGKWPLQLAVFICSMIGLSEIYHALSKKNYALHILGYLLSGAYMLILNDFSFNKFVIIFSAFIISLMISLIFSNSDIIDCLITFFGFCYVTFLMSFIILVRRQFYGEFFVWLIFISAWGCDTFAYFFGRLFGKNKLSPKLSPKKTIEGAVGGVLCATALGFAYSFFFAPIFNINYCGLNFFCAIICFVGAIFAQFGDLSASAIKRYGNLKDYGSILPGHGGFLDRFDSVLFTAPLVYMFIYFIRKFGGFC